MKPGTRIWISLTLGALVASPSRRPSCWPDRGGRALAAHHLGPLGHRGDAGGAVTTPAVTTPAAAPVPTAPSQTPSPGQVVSGVTQSAGSTASHLVSGAGSALGAAGSAASRAVGAPGAGSSGASASRSASSPGTSRRGRLLRPGLQPGPRRPPRQLRRHRPAPVAGTAAAVVRTSAVRSAAAARRAAARESRRLRSLVARLSGCMGALARRSVATAHAARRPRRRAHR